MLYPKIKTARLYHVAEDELEMHDLAGEAQQQKRMKALFAEFLKLQQQTGDTLDVKQAFPELL